MHTKASYARKALSFALIFAMMFTALATSGLFSQKDDWHAYAADNANAKYSLAGAEYTVYTNSGCTTIADDVNGDPAKFTTDASGNATSEIELEAGTYYVKETKASRGYILDSKVYKVKVDGGKTTWVEAESGGKKVYEIPQSVEIQIKKTANPAVEGNWPMKDAEFEIKYTDEDGLTRTWIVKTDANGIAKLDDAHFVSGDTRYKDSSGKYVVPLGKVTVKEIKPPLGYIQSTETKTFNIKWGGATSTNEHAVTFSGQVSSGGVVEMAQTSTVGKLDTLIKYSEGGEKGWRAFLGAEYTVKYYQVDPNTTEDLSSRTPTRTWVFKTREQGDSAATKKAGINFQTDEKISGDDFYIEKVIKNADGTLTVNRTDGTETRVLPEGVFSIEETKAPNGEARNEAIYWGKVQKTAPTAAAKTTINGHEDLQIVVSGGDNHIYNGEEDQHAVIKIKKEDASGESGLSLAGAEYEVYIKTPSTTDPEIVGKIVTDENGEGELTTRTMGDDRYVGNKLPLGKYLIVETKAAPGYAIDKYMYDDENKTEVEVPDGAIEVVCGWDANGNPITKTVNGTREDGWHVFETQAETVNVNKFIYTVTSKDEPTRTIIKKTDATTTKELPGATLQIIDKGGKIVEEWVSTEEEHLVYGLPDGTYTLREIKAPYGYDIAEDIQFTVEDGKIVTNVEMANKPVEVGTTATDVETETHQGVISETAKIKDLVQISGIYAGRTYKVTGKLIDKATKEPMKDKGGNEIIAEKEFTATGESMTVELEFEVDSSEFTKDTTVVAFEKLWRTSKVHNIEADVVPVEIGKHEDPDDEDQTIHYGGIVGTVATDQDEASKNILAGRETVIVDTVEYKNLSTKETYRLEAELYDKTTGERTGIKATAEFKPETPDGKAKVEFKFDSTSYAGHSLVAFEKLYLEATLIDEHEDPDDPDQTVEVTDYNIYKVRNELASEKGGKYGFEPGKTVTYNVVVENISDKASLKVDVSDKFTEKPEYFSLPKVVEVKNATENSRSSDGNKVNITIAAGEKAIVVYETTISLSAKEYLAKAAKDSDSLDADGKDCNRADKANNPDDKDGYMNVAKADNPTPFDPENPDKPYKPLPPKEDEAQIPVKVPEIGTYLADDANQKVIDGSDETTLIDTVAYKGLTKGNTYAVVGELMVKETGDPLVENGEPVKAVGVFTAEADSGSTEVEFVVKTKGLEGKHLVAFEVAYNITGTDIEKSEDPAPDEVKENGKKVAEHRNINDKDQAVFIKVPGKRPPVDTGDATVIGGFVAALGASLAGIFAMIRRRRKLQ